MSALVHVDAWSTYPRGKGGPMPDRMALLTPDARDGYLALADRIKFRGGRLVCSDMYRPYGAQLRAYREFVASVQNNPSDKSKWISKRSPPGGSMHEAGRAIDADLELALTLAYGLADLWDDMKATGWCPIIAKPDPRAREAWHWEFRGPFAALREPLGYTKMVRAAILDVGGVVEQDDKMQLMAELQYQLFRLGHPNDPELEGRHFRPDQRQALAVLVAQHGLGPLSNESLAIQLDLVDGPTGRYGWAGAGGAVVGGADDSAAQDGPLT